MSKAIYIPKKGEVLKCYDGTNYQNLAHQDMYVVSCTGDFHDLHGKGGTKYAYVEIAPLTKKGVISKIHHMKMWLSETGGIYSAAYNGLMI